MNRAEMDERVENTMIRLSLMDDTRYTLEDLESYCKELRGMLETKNPAKDDLFAGLPRVKSMICICALQFVESEDFQKIKECLNAER